MKRFVKNVVAPVVVAAGLSSLGAAISYASDAWQSEDMARARLVSAQTATNGDQSVILGFQIELKEGWKTYWRTPGDSGLPPVFNWSGSQNFKSAQVKWPRPEGFDSFGLSTWGYSKEILLPIQIDIEDPSKPLTAKLQVSYGVCEAVCVPIQQQFTVHLEAKKAVPTIHSERITHFEKRVPKSVLDTSYINALNITAISEDMIEIEVRGQPVFQNPEIILEGENGDYFELRKMSISEEGQRVVFGIGVDAVNRDLPLKGRQLTVTLLDENLAIEDSKIVE
ncbi:hypothetical protein GUA87_01935 [Sneathiella sp. P13V-1]|uniref:protein-disulfide reductase DsbD domain-containing protein n=1 Tax=Sneathiella sp. P13V-1 TaxID=2697366 RepID=UPI00187B4FD1|nr:protein-disulfide reductase DsbD domain-containing protein [Sneathiella sp. P13V-1]MBE7635588.1 hypothetical protein [Sneathiella sp. P13V-1]